MATADQVEPSTHDIHDPPSTDEIPASPFNTLWTEFARGRQRISPPRSPTLSASRRPLSAELSSTSKSSKIDLRALDYAAEYDSHLMCPICHVPFIEPVVLDCDHTFCEDCFNQYAMGGSNTDRSRCPACRVHHLDHVRKASRLIKNMCNDIQVHCPNKTCKATVARGCVEQHILGDCLEEHLPCPDEKCTNQTKRRNFVHGQCIHNSHVECECGATIQLGRGEWLRHKDQECPDTQLSNLSQLENSPTTFIERQCPGSQFGCTESLTADEVDTHTQSCVFARLAPYLKKQSLLLKTAQEQLTMAKLRNEALETSFTRLEEVITSTIQPKLDRLTSSNPRAHTILDPNDNDSISDIEEIPRPDLYNSTSQSLETFPLPTDNIVTHASNDPSRRQASQFSYHASHHNEHTINPVTTHLLSTTSEHASHLSSIDQSLQDLTAQIHDLDARSSMALMNETLRIREDLNILNGAMHSTRTQVQWLLNRERILGQREAMANGWAAGTRGRPLPQHSLSQSGTSMSANSDGGTSSEHPASNANNSNGEGIGTSTPTQASWNLGTGAAVASGNSMNTQTASTSGPTGYRPSFDRNMSSAWSTSQAVNSAGGGQSSSGHSSTATSPIFGAARPSLRRASGGSSQERVKL